MRTPTCLERSYFTHFPGYFPAHPSAPQITDAKVNIVNADLLAKKRGVRVSETVVATDGETIIEEMTVGVT